MADEEIEVIPLRTARDRAIYKAAYEAGAREAEGRLRLQITDHDRIVWLLVHKAGGRVDLAAEDLMQECGSIETWDDPASMSKVIIAADREADDDA